MPSSRSKADYRELERAYVTGDYSYRELGAKFGVNYSSLAQKAKRDNWAARRDEHRRQVAAKTYEHMADETARQAVIIRELNISVARKAVETFGAALDEGKAAITAKDAVEFMKYLVAATSDPKEPDGPNTVINLAQFDGSFLRQLIDTARQRAEPGVLEVPARTGVSGPSSD